MRAKRNKCFLHAVLPVENSFMGSGRSAGPLRHHNRLHEPVAVTSLGGSEISVSQ